MREWLAPSGGGGWAHRPPGDEGAGSSRKVQDECRPSLIKDIETSRLIFPDRTLKSKGSPKTQDPPRRAGHTIRRHGSRLATFWSGRVAHS